ncbi:two-partner secretion domain-containing protein [Pseudomonas aeruginosa]
MNKTYALIWNPIKGCWAVANEFARRRGKSKARRTIGTYAAAMFGLFALPSAQALPVDPAITHGTGVIATSVDGKTMTINQQTDKLITQWKDFSVGADERVSFQQPNSQSIALNRVVGSNGSAIHGKLDSNGKVFLVNPNGIVFGAGSQSNVGSLIASTRALGDGDFLEGNYRFEGTSSAPIAVSDGAQIIAAGGNVALLANTVVNDGLVQATRGRVALAAGDQFRVSFDNNDLLNLQVDGASMGALVKNGGVLRAEGGQVLMTARANGELHNAVVNNQGVIEARGLNNVGGQIILDAGLGSVELAGRLEAGAGTGSQKEGSVITKGHQVVVAETTKVYTRGNGQPGKWTIEADNAGVATGPDGNVESAIAATTLSRNLETNNVDLIRTSGSLEINGPISWNSNASLKLTARQGDVNVNHDIASTGSLGGIEINSSRDLNIGSKISILGGKGSVELNYQGKRQLNNNASVTLPGAGSSFKSNGTQYNVVRNADDLREVDTHLAARYVLGNDVSGGVVYSIGGLYSTPFSGHFDGLGNTISDTIVDGNGPYVGLFARNRGYIGDLNLHSISAGGESGWTDRGTLYIGGLVGLNYDGGVISNVKMFDSQVFGHNTNYNVIGGLVGWNQGGTIRNSGFEGQVVGSQFTKLMGGLVGENSSTDVLDAVIANSTAKVQLTGSIVSSSPTLPRLIGKAGGLVAVNTGDISNSSSESSIALSGEKLIVGGLIGTNGGSIESSTSQTKVTINGGNTQVGGLVGRNEEEGRILRAAAVGSVQSRGQDSYAGGLAGTNSGVISASNANVAVSGSYSSNVGGLVGQNGEFYSGTDYRSRARIDSSTADGRVQGGARTTVGGLAAVNYGKIVGSRANGNVSADVASYAGGLVGISSGSIWDSHAAGDVLGKDVTTVGGLVGSLSYGGIIQNSSASGNVEGGGNGTAIGGLVGSASNQSVIAASSSSGTIRAWERSYVGGLVGRLSGQLDASTTSSQIIVDPSQNTRYGGLVGQFYSDQGIMVNNTATGEAAKIKPIGDVVNSL